MLCFYVFSIHRTSVTHHAPRLTRAIASENLITLLIHRHHIRRKLYVTMPYVAIMMVDGGVLVEVRIVNLVVIIPPHRHIVIGIIAIIHLKPSTRDVKRIINTTFLVIVERTERYEGEINSKGTILQIAGPLPQMMM